MNTKKKIILPLLFIAAIIVFFVLRLYLNVSGTKITKRILLDSISTVKIVKTYETSGKSDVIKQAVLNDEQKKLLISLIENTKFKRIVSNAFGFHARERYLITAKASDGHEFFRLESYGGEFLLIDSMDRISPLKHWRLKIKNSEWKNTLEKILALSD